MKIKNYKKDASCMGGGDGIQKMFSLSGISNWDVEGGYKKYANNNCRTTKRAENDKKEGKIRIKKYNIFFDTLTEESLFTADKFWNRYNKN